MIRRRVDPAAPEAAVLREAAQAIVDGQLVILPTDTLYGLAADPRNAGAVRQVFTVKGRAGGQALPLIAADRAQVEQQLGPLSPLAARLAEAYWPGPLTLVVPAPGTIAAEVTGGTGTVGVRVPDHAVARGVCEEAGTTVTATSANLSGRSPSADPARAVAGLEDSVALLLDAGPVPGSPASTIVDVTGAEPRLVRQGAIEWEDIRQCLKRK